MDEMFVSSRGEDGEYFETEMVYLHDDLLEMAQFVQAFDFRSALKTFMEISSRGNQILQYNEPWKKIKGDPENAAMVLFVALQYVAAMRLAVRPFLPFTSDKLTSLLNLEAIEEKAELLHLIKIIGEGEAIIKVGHKLSEPLHLFTKIEDNLVASEMEKLASTDEPKSSPQKTLSANLSIAHSVFAPIKEEISYDDFSKLDIRTATIIEAERVPKADKLLKLTIDLGFEKRIVASGIAEHFSPEEIIGKKVTLLANLAPRTIRGIESKGMILMASSSDGKLSFISSDTDWENGATIS
jgi:methionyl-tRNA synthetase